MLCLKKAKVSESVWQAFWHMQAMYASLVPMRTQMHAYENTNACFFVPDLSLPALPILPAKYILPAFALRSFQSLRKHKSKFFCVVLGCSDEITLTAILVLSSLRWCNFNLYALTWPFFMPEKWMWVFPSFRRGGFASVGCKKM